MELYRKKNIEEVKGVRMYVELIFGNTVGKLHITYTTFNEGHLPYETRIFLAIWYIF